MGGVAGRRECKILVRRRTAVMPQAAVQEAVNRLDWDC
tara:strand:+ start:32908 stop:33021 length:114 start_codon:yes stop_codon:yes gene_type:complete